MGSGKYQKVLFGIAAISLLVFGYFAFLNGQDSKTANNLKKPAVSSQTNPKTTDSQQNQLQPGSKSIAKVSSELSSKTTDRQQNQLQPDINTTTPNKQDSNTSSTPTVNSSGKNNIAIKIPVSEVSLTAKFYPYKVDGTNMEIIAVKATDGTIRTALNTCQICWDSGRGYYVQEEDYLVCQNCGNRFHIDQIEKIKGGCNPVPILEKDKSDMGDYIAISNDFLATQKSWFSNWKTN